MEKTRYKGGKRNGDEEQRRSFGDSPRERKSKESETSEERQRRGGPLYGQRELPLLPPSPAGAVPGGGG